MSAIEAPFLIAQPPQTKARIRPKESDFATRTSIDWMQLRSYRVGTLDP
jgi:hypothetical protein